MALCNLFLLTDTVHRTFKGTKQSHVVEQNSELHAQDSKQKLQQNYNRTEQ